MPKVISSVEAAELINPGSSILFGGFLAVGAAVQIIDELVKKNTPDLHIIVIATDFDNKGTGKLVANRQVKSVQASHIGTNKATQSQMNSGEIKVELIPQGTLLERIRAAGAGLGGILTPTGIGTIVEDGKQIIEVDGKKYLLETPIKADFALIRAFKADKNGNLVYNKTGRNSNPIMATAADVTIVEADYLVDIGEISPEDVVTPGLFVDYIVHRS